MWKVRNRTLNYTFFFYTSSDHKKIETTLYLINWTYLDVGIKLFRWNYKLWVNISKLSLIYKIDHQKIVENFEIFENRWTH